jgi:PAS domain S-box-containing protein
MTGPYKASKTEPVPALCRLLSESALSRAALGACSVPLALIDANAPGRPVSYANAAFEGFFGYGAGEALGRSLAALVFRGDDSLLHRMIAEPCARGEARTWAKDGALRDVELTLGAIRGGAEGRITHWIAGFSDRTELVQLRAELEELKNGTTAAPQAA